MDRSIVSRSRVSRPTVTRSATATRSRLLSTTQTQALYALRPVNYFPLKHWQWNQWEALQAGTLTYATLLADFQRIASYGFTCVRTSVHARNGDFNIGAGCATTTPTPTQLAALTTWLTAARDAGLSVWLTLFDHYTSQSPFFNVADSQAWMSTLAGAFPASHTVALIELYNEATATMTGNAVFGAWLRGIIPSARTTFGLPLTVSSYYDTTAGPDGCAHLRNLITSYLAGQQALLDVYTLHCYPSGAMEQWPQYLAAARALISSGIPTLVGESGFATSFNDTAHLPAIPNNIASRESLQEFFVRYTTAYTQAAGMGWPLYWIFYDASGVTDPTLVPAYTHTPAGTTFGATINLAYAWTNASGAGSTTAKTFSATITAGDSITIPAMIVPFGATGLQVYVQDSGATGRYLSAETGATQSGLVGDGTTRSAAVTITTWGLGTTAPTVNTTQTNLGTGNPAADQLSYGLYRHDEEPNPSSAKPVLATYQSIVTGGVSSDWNGGFEKATLDSSGVAQWPAYWRLNQPTHAFISVAIDATTARPGSPGVSSLKLFNAYTDNASTSFGPGVLGTPIVGPLDPTKTYTLAGWAKVGSVPTGGNITCRMSWWGANNNFLSSTAAAISNTFNGGAWGQFTAVASKPPAGAVALTVELRLNVGTGAAGAPGSGAIWFDDLSVTAT